eukprot:SAG22_NODE_427_length_10603_cov_19.158225_5_plen_258_part_00
MHESYAPNGWLGMMLGARLWIGFFGAALSTETMFESKIAELVRQLPPSPSPPPPPAIASATTAKISAPAPASVTSAQAAVAAHQPRSAAGGTVSAVPVAAAAAAAAAGAAPLKHALTPGLPAAPSAWFLCTTPELAALQSRVDGMVAAGLLAAGAAEALEDVTADFVAAIGWPLPIGADAIAEMPKSSPAARLHLALNLSAAFSDDGKLARQFRRANLVAVVEEEESDDDESDDESPDDEEEEEEEDDDSDDEDLSW